MIADLILEAVLSDTPDVAYSAGPLCDEFLGAREKLNDGDFHNFFLEKFDLMDLKV